jgi:paraquat-inducible protein A
MIDVFMISLLVALLQFGTLISVHPGPGAIAFAGVVILTMFAARTFDPRLTWDAAGLQSPETLPPAAPPSAAEDPHRAGAPA